MKTMPLSTSYTTTGKEFTNTLRDFSNKCWRRATLIIGHALAGIPIVPRPEDLPNDVVESLGDILGKCGVDDYLLVGNKIPQLIWYLIKNHARALAKVFINKYNGAVSEVRRVLNIARGRAVFMRLRVLWSWAIINNSQAVKLNKVVKPGDADAALHIASFAIQHVASTDLIMLILDALRPLRGKAPQRYLEVLAFASNREDLDSDTVVHIFYELNEILDDYGDVLGGMPGSSQMQ